MSDITLEKNHALLEKLAEYVMNKIPQIETELTKKATKDDLFRIEEKLRQKTEKKDLDRVEEKINRLLEGIDHQAKEIDDFRVEKKAICYTLDVHEERLGTLEERSLGYRVRDVDAGEEEGRIEN